MKQALLARKGIYFFTMTEPDSETGASRAVLGMRKEQEAIRISQGRGVFDNAANQEHFDSLAPENRAAVMHALREDMAGTSQPTAVTHELCSSERDSVYIDGQRLPDVQRGRRGNRLNPRLPGEPVETDGDDRDTSPTPMASMIIEQPPPKKKTTPKTRQKTRANIQDPKSATNAPRKSPPPLENEGEQHMLGPEQEKGGEEPQYLGTTKRKAPSKGSAHSKETEARGNDVIDIGGSLGVGSAFDNPEAIWRKEKQRRMGRQGPYGPNVSAAEPAIQQSPEQSRRQPGNEPLTPDIVVLNRGAGTDQDSEIEEVVRKPDAPLVNEGSGPAAKDKGKKGFIRGSVRRGTDGSGEEQPRSSQETVIISPAHESSHPENSLEARNKSGEAQSLAAEGTPHPNLVSPQVRVGLQEREFLRALKEQNRNESEVISPAVVRPKAMPPPLVNRPELPERTLGEDYQEQGTSQEGNGVLLPPAHRGEERPEELVGDTEPGGAEFRPIRDPNLLVDPAASSSPVREPDPHRSEAGSVASEEVHDIMRSLTPYLDCPPPVDMTKKPAATKKLQKGDKRSGSLQEVARSKRGVDLRFSSDPGQLQRLMEWDRKLIREERPPTFLGTLNDQNRHMARNRITAPRSPDVALQLDDQGWPALQWQGIPAIPSLPSLNNTLDAVLAQDYPDDRVETGPTRADVDNLGIALRGNFVRTQREVDRRVNEIGLKAGTKCQKFSQEMRELCERRLHETRETLERYEGRALAREQDHKEQEKHSLALAGQVMNSMRTVLDVNKRNFGLYEENMNTITEHGRLVLQELVSEQEKVTQRGVSRLEMVRQDFKRNFTQTVGANNRAEVNVQEIQKAFGEANLHILAQQQAYRTKQLDRLSELDEAVRELALTLQALDLDIQNKTVRFAATPDIGIAEGSSGGNITTGNKTNESTDPDAIISDPLPANDFWSEDENQASDEAVARDLHAFQLEEAKRYAQRGKEKDSSKSGEGQAAGENSMPALVPARRLDPGVIMRPPLEKLIEPFDGEPGKGDFSDFHKRICQAVEGQGQDDSGAKRECLNWFLRGQARDALDAFRTDSNAAGKPPTLEEEVDYLKRMYDRKPVITSQDILNTYQLQREDFRNYYIRLRTRVSKCTEENFLGDENQKAATLQQLKAGVLGKYATVDFMNAKTIDEAFQAYEREEIHQERHAQSREAQERRAAEEAKRTRQPSPTDESDKRYVHSLTQDDYLEESGEEGNVAMIGGIDPKRVYRIMEPPAQEEEFVPNYEHFCEYHNCPGHKTSECKQFTSRPGYFEALSGEPSQPPPQQMVPHHWPGGYPPGQGRPPTTPYGPGQSQSIGPRFPSPNAPAYWTGIGSYNRGRPTNNLRGRGSRGRGFPQGNRVGVVTMEPEPSGSSADTCETSTQDEEESSSVIEIGTLFPTEEFQGPGQVSTAFHCGDTAPPTTAIQPTREQLLKSMEQVGRHAARVAGGTYIPAKEKAKSFKPRFVKSDDEGDVPHDGCDWNEPPNRPVFWNTELPKNTREPGVPTIYVSPPEEEQSYPPRHVDQYLQSLSDERTEMDESEPKWLSYQLPATKASYLRIRTAMMKPLDADLAQRREEATRVYDLHEKKEQREMDECMAESERGPSEVPIRFQVPFPHYVMYEDRGFYTDVPMFVGLGMEVEYLKNRNKALHGFDLDQMRRRRAAIDVMDDDYRTVVGGSDWKDRMFNMNLRRKMTPRNLLRRPFCRYRADNGEIEEVAKGESQFPTHRLERDPPITGTGFNLVRIENDEEAFAREEEARSKHPISEVSAQKDGKEIGSDKLLSTRNMPRFTQPVSGPEHLASFSKNFRAERDRNRENTKGSYDQEVTDFLEQQEWEKWRDYPKIRAGMIDYQFRFPGYQPPRVIATKAPTEEGRKKKNKRSKARRETEPNGGAPSNPKQLVNPPIVGEASTSKPQEKSTLHLNLMDAPKKGRGMHPVVAQHHPANGHKSARGRKEGKARKKSDSNHPLFSTSPGRNVRIHQEVRDYSRGQSPQEYMSG